MHPWAAAALLGWNLVTAAAVRGPSPPSPCDGSCVDGDGDGLCDFWEVAGGIDLDGDGHIDPVNDLELPGADPARPDVYLQYDYMVLRNDGNPCVPAPTPQGPYDSPDCAVDQYCIGNRCLGHSDAPSKWAMRDVVQAFARGGVALHVLPVHHRIPHARVLSFGTPFPECSLASQALPPDRRAVDFYSLKARYFNARRKQAYHYAVFGHFHTCDSVADCNQAICANADTGRTPLFGETGLAEQPGNDIIVSFGRFRDRAKPPAAITQGGTLMHELGHNLGLDHGGPVDGDPTGNYTVNFKPNHMSVMSYAFQASGIESASPDCAPGDAVCRTTPVAARLDYANASLPELDETSLEEPDGVGSGDDISFTFCPDRRARPGSGPVDWNCDGDATQSGLTAEVNNDGVLGRLLSRAEWPNLNFRFACASTYNDLSQDPSAVTHEELTADEILARLSGPAPRTRR